MTERGVRNDSHIAGTSSWADGGAVYKMQTTEGKMLLGGRLCREGEFLFGPVPFEARRARSGWELLAWRELTERGEERPQVGLRGLANLERLGRRGQRRKQTEGLERWEENRNLREERPHLWHRDSSVPATRVVAKEPTCGQRQAGVGRKGSTCTIQEME